MIINRDKINLEYLAVSQKLSEHNVLLSVVKHTQTVIRRSKSIPTTPPIEMLNVNAERMDLHDAMNKYKVF